MGDKRSRPQHGSNNGYQNQHANKKHKPNQHHNQNRTRLQNNGHDNFRPNGVRPRPNLTKSDLEVGLIPLLDQLAHEEGARFGNEDIVHHAQELRRLLSKRAEEAGSSKSRQELDIKNPETEKLITVPPYLEQRIVESKELPPLPAITEPHLEEATFTHRGLTTGQPKGQDDGLVSYERLEFLGDAILELVASRLVYSRFPNLAPSHQSELRELLVRNDTLAKFSRGYNLSARIKLDTRAMEHSTKAWDKITADVFEAYIAAIVLSEPDTGFSKAEAWLTELWAPQVLNYVVPMVKNPLAKDEINRLVVAPGAKVEYRMEKDMVTIKGRQTFFIGAYLTGWGYENQWLGSGEGQNKAQAGTNAAADALRNSMDILKKANEQKTRLYFQQKAETKQEEKKQDGVKKA